MACENEQEVKDLACDIVDIAEANEAAAVAALAAAQEAKFEACEDLDECLMQQARSSEHDTDVALAVVKLRAACRKLDRTHKAMERKLKQLEKAIK